MRFSTDGSAYPHGLRRPVTEFNHPAPAAQHPARANGLTFSRRVWLVSRTCARCCKERGACFARHGRPSLHPFSIVGATRVTCGRAPSVFGFVEAAVLYLSGHRSFLVCCGRNSFGSYPSVCARRESRSTASANRITTVRSDVRSLQRGVEHNLCVCSMRACWPLDWTKGRVHDGATRTHWGPCRTSETRPKI